MAYEKSFVMLKPGVRERKLLGELLQRFERKNLDILSLKLVQIDEALAKTHYQEHITKGFFPELLKYICSSPVLAMVIGGESAIARIRALCGATKIEDAAAGTIRGDYALTTTENLVHASDSPQSAAREISLFFSDDPLLSR